jgi:peptidoglycan/xylan/chitin deacetylase (PgdA/CDA1 family)
VNANPSKDESTSVAKTMEYQQTASAFQPTLTATITSTPPPTATPTVQPTPTWVHVDAGKVTVPIILYHHIDETETPNRYYIPPAQFETQMAWLHDNGYTSISASYLAGILRNGGDLPARPVVITFDDGDMDVYKNAFPVMQKYGFTATFYIIAGWIGSKYTVTNDQINEMVTAGWEIGSHSMTHVDLTKSHDNMANEVDGSKKKLQDTFHVQVDTFAYPFGAMDAPVANEVYGAGYKGAMGLGVSTVQGPGNLFYLSRIEIRSDYDMDKFISLLPWK